MSDTDPRIAVLSQANVEHVPGPADVTTVLVTLPPGSAGSPPHRHPGPVFGYLISGEMRFEVEGEPERIIRAGEAFWEPGGDLIHYQDATTSTTPRPSSPSRQCCRRAPTCSFPSATKNWPSGLTCGRRARTELRRQPLGVHDRQGADGTRQDDVEAP